MRNIRRIGFLFIFLVVAIGVFSKEYGKDVEVKIKANVIKPVKIGETKDIDFGNIPAGKSARTTGVQNGFISIETSGKMYVTWKEKDSGNYQEIDSPLLVTMRKQNSEENMVANIKANFGNGTKLDRGNNYNVLVEPSGGKIIFSGEIDKVPSNAQGEYKGVFLVRVEYRDEL